MKKLKIIASIVICIAMIVPLAACSMVSVDEEKAANQVVAQIGDYQILKKDFTDMFTPLMSYYGYDESYLKDAANKENVASMKKSFLDDMVSDEVEYQYAVANGFALTDEEKKTVQDDINSTIESYTQSIRESVQAQASSDPSIDVEAQVSAQADELLANYKTDKYLQDSIKTKVLQKYEESITSTVSVTDEQVRERYDAEVANQQNMVDDAKTYAMLSQFGSTIYVYPEGTKAVKNLLIKIPDDKETQISTYRKNNNDAQAETILNEELAKIKTKADEVLAKVQAGEDFDSLLEQYGEDTGMTQEPAKTDGYYVYQGANYVQPFIDASLALQNVGDTSGLVASDYGYHIIKLIGIPDQVTPFEKIQTDLKATMQSDAEQSALEQKRTELVKAANAKVYYDRL